MALTHKLVSSGCRIPAILAAGKLDGVSVSSMLAIYDAHGMVRGRNRLDVVWAV